MAEVVCFRAALGGVFHACAVVEVEAQTRQGDAEGLDWGRGAAEPDDCEGDDPDALDERGDGVGDG